MRRHGSSLRRTLTKQMVIMQTLVLLVFTFMAAMPIINLISTEQGLDAAIIDDIARAVQRADNGGLVLEPSKRLSAVEAEYPNFWFYVTDVDGKTVSTGAVPDHVALMAINLTRINSANIADIGNPEAPIAIIRQHGSDAGRLWIVTAGGPRIGLQMLVIAFSNPIFLGLLFLLTVVSLFVIPVIVKRQLRGLEAVAAEADRIDVDQPGVRLSSGSVPDELHPMVRAINSALERLDEGMERRQRFLADAAHELRTPIAILQTRIELLPHGEERSRLMLDIARLANLANQLLDLQRLDADYTTFRPVDLVDLAAQVTAEMAPLAIAAGDEVSFDAEADTVTVDGDPASLSRALTNLIQNAIAHGGRKTLIRVAVGRDGSLRVTDTGPGIAPQHRQAIFEPFHRIVPLEHGAGLGLNLVKDIVVRHHGQVTVGDAPGGGALFEIALPLAGQQRQPA